MLAIISYNPIMLLLRKLLERDYTLDKVSKDV